MSPQLLSRTIYLFNPRFKLPLHIIQLILIVAAIGLSAPRLFMKNQPRTRANTIALGMGAKSLIIIQYQILTEHVRQLARYGSLKAYAILNGLEIVFWGAVVFLVIQANISVCVGVGCILSWVVVGIAIVLTFLAVYAFGITFLEFRASRRRVRTGIVKVEGYRGGNDGSPDNQLEQGQGKSGKMADQHAIVAKK